MDGAVPLDDMRRDLEADEPGRIRGSHSSALLVLRALAAIFSARTRMAGSMGLVAVVRGKGGRGI